MNSVIAGMPGEVIKRDGQRAQFDVAKILPHYEAYYERVVENSKAVDLA